MNRADATWSRIRPSTGSESAEQQSLHLCEKEANRTMEKRFCVVVVSRKSANLC